MNTLAEILEELRDEYHGCEPEKHYCSQDSLDEAINKIEALMLEVIGEDDLPQVGLDTETKMMNDIIHTRNVLRRQLRANLHKKLGQKDVRE